MQLKDLPPNKDPKGGSKTPQPIPRRCLEQQMTPAESAVVSLKEHFGALLKEQDRRIQQALDSAKAAVDKADLSQERRLVLLNEFREQSADESRKYALKDVVEALSRQVQMLYGGLLVVGIIGIANLVKLFFAH